MAPRDNTDTSTEERRAEMGGTLPSVRRQNWADILMLGAIVVLGSIAIGSSLNKTASPFIEIVVTFGLVAIAFAGAYNRLVSRTDHVRALQSDRMLKIANESLSYLRLGLTEQTAGEVCAIVLRETEAAAVAITDRESVLGFAGVGEDHHLVGGPIITRATHEAVVHDEPRILHNRLDIGCPEPGCHLEAAIVVPLQMRDQAVGTLKFYYTSDQFLNETQLAMAEGLARLLSTQIELSELERQTELATEMELKALQAQINPHFLFNTINTIAAFIRIDPGEARRLLRRFGAFYRRTLEHAEDLVSLEQELEFVSAYLELEQARFGERLRVVFDTEPDTLRVMLPAFMLQPLVENAVGHGMRPDGSVLTVTVAAHVRNGELCLSVGDDGCGIPADRLPHVLEPGAGKGLGIALRNVRDRLVGHFGPESQMDIESTVDVGTRVQLTIRPLMLADKERVNVAY